MVFTSRPGRKAHVGSSTNPLPGNFACEYAIIGAYIRTSQNKRPFFCSGKEPQEPTVLAVQDNRNVSAHVGGGLRV
jgi:hypothetical protein